MAFSAAPVGIYQGTITLLAGLLRPYMTDLMITRISLCGLHSLIFALGMNMVLNSKIKIGNMLPAIFMPVFYMSAGILEDTFREERNMKFAKRMDRFEKGFFSSLLEIKTQKGGGRRAGLSI